MEMQMSFEDDAGRASGPARPPDDRRCTATNSRGRRCGNRRAAGLERCRSHEPPEVVMLAVLMVPNDALLDCPANRDLGWVPGMSLFDLERVRWERAARARP
jgi:hypothetical protein